MAEEKEINEQENTTNEQEVVNDANQESDAPIEQTPEEKYAELNDKFLRLYAEFDNFRKRSNKEKVDLIINANAGVLTDLIPVLDDFERAILNNESATEIEVVKEGYGLLVTSRLATSETLYSAFSKSPIISSASFLLLTSAVFSPTLISVIVQKRLVFHLILESFLCHLTMKRGTVNQFMENSHLN